MIVINHIAEMPRYDVQTVLTTTVAYRRNFKCFQIALQNGGAPRGEVRPKGQASKQIEAPGALHHRQHLSTFEGTFNIQTPLPREERLDVDDLCFCTE